MNSTSGQGKQATVPPELAGWNWGAFLLNWVWGVGNHTFSALLVFVPVFGLVMPFVLGAKGNDWAWRNKRWDSVEQFRAVQRKWLRWALILYPAVIAGVVALFFAISAGIKTSDAFQLSLSTLEASAEGQQRIGSPVDTGFPMGEIRLAGSGGEAQLSYSVSGPKGEGRVHVHAIRQLGKWRIEQMVLEDEAAGEQIPIPVSAASEPAAAGV